MNPWTVLALLLLFSFLHLVVLLFIWRQLMLTAQDIKDAQTALTAAIQDLAARAQSGAIPQATIQQILDTSAQQLALVQQILPAP